MDRSDAGNGCETAKREHLIQWDSFLLLIYIILHLLITGLRNHLSSLAPHLEGIMFVN